MEVLWVHKGISLSVWHVNRLQLINKYTYFAVLAEPQKLIPLKSKVFQLQVSDSIHISEYLTTQVDLSAMREEKLEEDGDWWKTGGEDETQEQEMKDATEDRMGAKTKQHHEDRDGNLEKSERASEGTGVTTKAPAVWKRAGECVWEKQLSRGVSQCEGRLIRKCVPPPAGLVTSSCCGQLI